MVDLALNLIGFVLLLLWARGHRPRGMVTGASLVVFGISRFIYEFFRMGTVEEVQRNIASSTQINGWPVTEAHLTAAAIVIAGVVLMLLSRGRPVDTVDQPGGAPETGGAAVGA